VEPVGLRTPIIMLRHITRARAKQILSPCVIALQVAFFGRISARDIKKWIAMSKDNTVGQTISTFCHFSN
jgi:hypothetical protein